MKYIKKIIISNFKRYQRFELDLDSSMNLLVGDNEAGKSTILSAINLVLSGSRSKVESLRLENLFNADVINEFLNGDKDLGSLPNLFVEVYLNEQNNASLYGRNNSLEIDSDGLRLSCEPIQEFSNEINQLLQEDNPMFPFEFYSIKFSTFAGDPYSGYKKYMNHLFLDSTQINNDYAVREYVRTVYRSKVSLLEKNKHQNEYRRSKESFKNESLSELNNRLENYKFSMKAGSQTDFENDLTITEDNISIENKGKGRQCFIKAEFALSRNSGEESLDVLLMEEPENHLSHLNMKKLINRISLSEDKQVIIATHSSLISTRLDLRKSILLNSSSFLPVLLKDIPEETAKFFMKAPDNNILELILSKKVILVEGDAEFILFEALFNKVTSEKIEESDVHVLSVDGTSFKRYLDLTKKLGIKTAVVRDNDGNATLNCVENYSEYISDTTKIFYEEDNAKKTFEVCLYETNQEICEELFSAGRRTLSVQEYMLKNKTEVAFELLDKKSSEINVPGYVKDAIEWIRE